jgi:hypothetical protein
MEIKLLMECQLCERFPSETQKPSAKKGLGNIMAGNEPPETITEILTRHCHMTGHLFRVRLVKLMT